MGYHAVYILRTYIETERITTLFFAAGAGFLVGTLHVVLIKAFIEYITIFRRVSGAMHQACCSPVGRSIGWPI